MAELVKEQVFLDQLVGDEKVQMMLEGDLIVPDIKPDMAFLLQTDEKVTIERTEVGTDRVNIVGHLNISVLYMAKGMDRSVQSIQLSRSIDDFINLEGVNNGTWVRVKAELVNIDYRVVNDRKVNYRAVINIHAVAQNNDAYEMVVHINDVPENQLLKQSLTVSRTAAHHTDRFQVKDHMLLPAAKPNVLEILQAAVTITSQDVRLSSGRVHLNGELQCIALYRGDTEDSLLEFVEFEIPFNGTMDLPGVGEEMLADVWLQVLDQQVTVRTDDDGEDRALEVEVSIGVEMKVHSAETLQMLEDAYIINQQLDCEKAVVRYPQLVCLNRNQTHVKEVVAIGGNDPDILQIIRVKGQAYLDEVQAVEDKIIVEGAISADILYVAQSDAMPLAGHRAMVPYRQVIEARGASPGMAVNVDASIEHVIFNMLSPREIEVRFQMTFNTQVTGQAEVCIVENVEIKDMPPDALTDQPSMTVYVVQNGDNAWKIAKKYNMPLDELTAVNELENHMKITAGQKLLILKKGM